MRKKINVEALNSLREELKHPPEKQWQTYNCTLVTPMYGGGVEAGKVDEKMPIRASSIRGQLRFWWRIACGYKYENDLFAQETAIWGGIGDNGATASQVEIRVRPFNISPSLRKTVDEFKRQSAIGIKYVLGSINGPSAKLPSILPNVKNISFDIDVYSSEEAKPDVEIALRWWASFGGVGAKTRRGFGAVKIEGIESIPLATFDSEQTSKGCKLEFIKKQQYDTAQEAWEVALKQLYNYRQGLGIGRNYKMGEDAKGKPIRIPTRTYWPDADQVRHLTGKNDNKRHMPEFEKNLIFPRAAFGMPIKFQFPGKNNDPDDMTLQPIDSERMASPLILRPYLDENKKWRALALLLPSWKKALTQSLTLEPSSENKTSNSQKLIYQVNHWPDENQQAERDRLTNDIDGIKPMIGRSNDPLSAFLDYFKEGNS